MKMNLNLNPGQFLIVYNAVSCVPGPEAQEIKEKMEAIILDALSAINDVKTKDKFSYWIKQEEDRVSAMNEELKSINPTTTKKKKGK